MSYDTLASSREEGQPIEFYDFGLADEQFNYTSAEHEITIGAITYTPIALERSNLLMGAELRADVLTITMPSDLPPADRFVLIVPGQLASLSIKRYHSTDTPTPELVTVFKGLVRSVGFTNNGYMAQLNVVPLTYGLGREVPRFTFQGLCNHVLYDEGCKVSQGSFDFAGTVTVVDGNDLTIPGVTTPPDGYYSGGFVQLGTNDWRLILDHVGDVLTLLLPFPIDVTDESVVVVAGCDHTLAICKSTFDNVINYGGFAFVPTKDIFRNGLT